MLDSRSFLMIRRAFAVALALIAATLLVPSTAQAQPGEGEYIVHITNLTRAQVFSPPLVVSHKATVTLFVPGRAPIPELAALAEDGMTQPLIDLALSLPEVVKDAVAADGPVMPGKSIEIRIPAGADYNRITVAGMLVQTNDSFFALRNAELPAGFSRSSTFVPAFDAGSEANNESCDFIPGPPCGNGGVRATEGAEGFIYVSNGMRGIGDLPADRYDWRNPVARIVIRRAPGQ
jgi:hypothetical protein